jgi:hypothetical protein
MMAVCLSPLYLTMSLADEPLQLGKQHFVGRNIISKQRNSVRKIVVYIKQFWYGDSLNYWCYKKLKLPQYTPRGRLGGEKYSSYSFSTSAVDGGEWSASRPGRALAPAKGPPVPIVQEAAWAPEPVWTRRLEEKSSRLCRGSNLDHPVVHPIATLYWLSYPGSFWYYILQI